MKKFLDFFGKVPNPDEWPRWLYWLFVCTLPVSGPLYVAVFVAWLATLSTLTAVLGFAVWVEYLNKA